MEIARFRRSSLVMVILPTEPVNIAFSIGGFGTRRKPEIVLYLTDRRREGAGKGLSAAAAVRYERRAFHGFHQEGPGPGYDPGQPGKAAPGLCGPHFSGDLFQQLYNLADTAIAGHMLGDTALAQIGATAALYSMLTGFAFGLNTGFALVVSRFFGAGMSGACAGLPDGWLFWRRPGRWS